MNKINNQSDISLPQQIKEDICSNIDNGTLKPGDKLPSEDRMAADYGVSRITARQALLELVSSGVLKRVHGKGTFVNSESEKRDSEFGTDNRFIAVMVPNLKISFFLQLINGIQQSIARDRYDVILFVTNSDFLTERESLLKIQNGIAKGLIVVPGNWNDGTIELINEIKKQIPVVGLNGHINNLDIDWVYSDDRHGAFLATNHLIELGHTRIAHLSAAEERLKGYCDALEEHSIQFDPSLVRKSGYNDNGGYSETRKLLLNRSDFTSIFACSDPVAEASIKALNESEIKVPDDIAVVGYGNTEIATYSHASLTTIDQSPFEMGNAAANLMREKLSGHRNINETTELKYQCKLIVRRSCGIQLPLKAMI